MEKIEKILLLAVLVAALLIIAVMSLFPEEKTSLDGSGRGDVYAKDKVPSKVEANKVEADKVEAEGELAKVHAPEFSNKKGIEKKGTLQAPGGLRPEEDDGGIKGLLTLDDGGDESTGVEGPGALKGQGGVDSQANPQNGGLSKESLAKGSQGMGETVGGENPNPMANRLQGAAPSLEEGGQFLRYTIQKGDAFTTILEKVCGTARQPVRELVLAANEQLDQNRIIAGHVLLIPKEAMIMGKKLLAQAKVGNRPWGTSPSSGPAAGKQEKLPGVGAQSATQELDSAVSGFAGIISLKRAESSGRAVVTEGSLYRASPIQKKGASAAPKSRGVRTYTVKKGDSFWKIAAKLLPPVSGESKAKRGVRIHRLVQKLQDLNPEYAGGALDVGNKIRVPR